VLKLSTGHLEKSIAYHCHLINQHRKHDYLLGQMGNADECFQLWLVGGNKKPFVILEKKNFPKQKLPTGPQF
jgi:hypothetical protein